MELISKREVLKIIEEETLDDEYKCEDGSWESYLDFQYEDAIKRINELPTIESRPKGKWKLRIDERFSMFKGYYCSCCGKDAEVLQAGGGCELLSNFCPYCGADMRGEE